MIERVGRDIGRSRSYGALISCLTAFDSLRLMWGRVERLSLYFYAISNSFGIIGNTIQSLSEIDSLSNINNVDSISSRKFLSSVSKILSNKIFDIFS